MKQNEKIEYVAPKIENFTSAIEFLKSYYSFKKSINPGFSFDAWSAEANMKSRSHLKMILDKKRRLTPQATAKLSQSLSLNSHEAEYFSLLVKTDQATDQNEKNLFLNRVFEMKGSLKKVLEVRRYSEFLSSLLLPKLQVLLSFDDLNRTPQGLAEFLGLPVSLIEEHLEKLKEIDLAVVTSDNVWQAKESSFRVPQNLGQPALRKYHDLCLDEAKKAQDLPLENRRFKSILLPLNEQQKQGLIEEINNFISKAVSKYDSSELEHKQIFKFNLNFYPVTKMFTKS